MFGSSLRTNKTNTIVDSVAASDPDYESDSSVSNDNDQDLLNAIADGV